MKRYNVGIIGYGSMGEMLFNRFCAADLDFVEKVLVCNRTKDKLAGVDKKQVCSSDAELASAADIVFLCVRPVDLKSVLEEIKPVIMADKIVISLNGNITFADIQKVLSCKTAKVVPSVTAEINRSQTLVCYNSLIGDGDKITIRELLESLGNVIELPEAEMGMGSELVSCMPGFIASIFDVIFNSARKHTEIPDSQIVEMLLKTLSATSSLMLEKKMSFQEVVGRVATKGGITQEGTAVVYGKFPEIADELFVKTLAKRRLIAENAERSF